MREDAPDPPKNDVNINDNYDDEKNDYEVNPVTPTNGGNKKTIENDEEKNYKDEAENETGNANLNLKSNDKKNEKVKVKEEDEENEEIKMKRN